MSRLRDAKTARKSGTKKGIRESQNGGLWFTWKISTNSSLCPYYKMLWLKNKKLLTLGKINSFYISSDTIRIKINENGSPLSATHVDHFGKHFPDIDLSPSRSGSICINLYVHVIVVASYYRL